jgi:pilus assembly protein TadC
MLTTEIILTAGIWFTALIAIVVLTVRLMLARQRLRDRLFADVAPEPLPPADDEQGPLERWLFLAGFRDERAPRLFIVSTAVCSLIGLGLVFAVRAAGTVQTMVFIASSIPGNVGEVFLPLAYASPWLMLVIMASLPALVVRARRRKRVQQVEQDLPILLDLLATLAEAGLGLDAAIDRVLDSIPPERALPQEFRAFQRDSIAGRPRVLALRLLGRRVSVPWFSMFVSAVVQAEQIGAGLAEVLKVQAEDLRQRRKEQALAFAMATPVKLLLPMIVCFMPGIFVAALGPVFFEIFQFLDNFTQGMR